MKRAGLLAAALLAALLAAPSARATTFKTKEVRCPVCEKGFPVREPRSTNTYGGLDADGTACPNGDSARAAFVWACPHCLYSREFEAFEKGTTEEARKRLLAEVPKERPFPEDAAQEAIPAWRKYELAILVLEREGAKGADVAWIAARASLAVREEGRALLHPEERDPDAPPGWRAALDRAWDFMQEADRGLPGTRTRSGAEIRGAREALREAEDTKGPEVPWRRLVLAGVLRAHGENAGALPLLAAVREGKDSPEAARELAARLEEGIAKERAFQERFSGFFSRGPTKAPRGEKARDNAWFVSDVKRRLGRDAEAAEWLGRALSAEEPPDWLLLLLRDAAEWAGEATPLWRKAVHEAWDARVRLLLSRLADEDAGEDAADRLADLAEPSILPALADLLASKDPVASQYAAAALAGYEEPGKEIVAVLERLLADADGDLLVRWRAAGTLAGIASPSSRAAFLSALAEDSDSLREAALAGLGLVGEAEDVPRLLEAAKSAPKEALLALRRLCFRSFESAEEAAAWWKGRAKESREAWALETLRRGDADLPAPPSRPPAPDLLDLLEHEDSDLRWAAARALRAESGRHFSLSQVLSEGKADNPQPPDVPLDTDRVLSDGWTVSYMGGFAFDVDNFAPLAKPLRERDARRHWEMAAGRWRRWWRESGR